MVRTSTLRSSILPAPTPRGATPTVSAARLRRGLRACALLAAPVAVLGVVAATSLVPAGAGHASTTGVKGPISGLIDRQGVPPTTALPYVGAYVVKVNWADLQAQPFGPITPNNAIDKAIARVRMPDLAGKMLLKLRVFAGIGAPEWAKEIGGAPLPYLNNQASSLKGGTIGRFWLPEYGAAYADLETKLAALYDGVPEIREVTVSRCSTLFDEAFVREPGVAANLTALNGAGYTVAADEQCIRDSIAIHSVWAHTISDVDFSPFPDVETGHMDLPFTLATMDYCRATLGPRCGLENNGLASSKLIVKNFVAMYTYMHQLGGTITFQTATSSRIGDWLSALRAGIAYGAGSLELPVGYTGWPVAELVQVRNAAKAAGKH
jgi:hypothetical protein